jgi:ketosteroid isomerase-like protein
VSDPDLELVERLFELFNRRDESLVALFSDEQAELHPAGADAGTVYRGHDGIRAYLADLWDIWEESTVEQKAVAPVGDRLLIEYTTHARGRGSGIDVDQDFFLLLTIRDGRVLEWRNFEGRDEALRVAESQPTPG